MTDWIEGYRGRPVVFGTCLVLARRWELPVWGVRAAAVVLLLVWTLLSIAGYIVVSLLLPETRGTAKQGLKDFGAWCVEVGGKLVRLFRAWMRRAEYRDGTTDGSPY